MIRQTSVDAYNQIKAEGLLSERRLDVYTVIVHHGPMTISQTLTHLVKFKRNTSSFTARISELEKMSLIKEHHTGPCPITGRQAIFWIATNNLPIKFEKPEKTKCKHCDGKGYFIEQQTKMF